MKTVTRIVLLLVMAMFATTAYAETSASIIKRYNKATGYYFHYSGIMERGKQSLNIEMCWKYVNNNSNELVGKYRYIRNGKPGNWLGLKGYYNPDGMEYHFKEYTSTGKNTGEFIISLGASGQMGGGCFWAGDKEWDVDLFWYDM